MEAHMYTYRYEISVRIPGKNEVRTVETIRANDPISAKDLLHAKYPNAEIIIWNERQM